MEIKKIVDFGTDENCYVLSDGETCFIVDPGNSYGKVLEYIKEKGLKTEKILLTHCHWDHTVGAKKLKEALGAKVAASRECKENIQNCRINVSELFGDPFEEDIVDETLEDGEEIFFGSVKAVCVKTPGHTSCGVCYIVEKNIFSGDTLFSQTVGRWDFPTGDFETLASSIRTKLYVLDGYAVYPGHGESTAIEREKRFNACVTE